jgi:hypothetical protein
VTGRRYSKSSLRMDCHLSELVSRLVWYENHVDRTFLRFEICARNNPN